LIKDDDDDDDDDESDVVVVFGIDVVVVLGGNGLFANIMLYLSTFGADKACITHPTEQSATKSATGDAIHSMTTTRSKLLLLLLLLLPLLVPSLLLLLVVEVEVVVVVGLMVAPVESVKVDIIDTKPCTRNPNPNPLLLETPPLSLDVVDDVVVFGIPSFSVGIITTITSSKTSVKCGVNISNKGHEPTIVVVVIAMPSMERGWCWWWW